MSTWDDPDLAAGGEFYTFENIGDTASGVIKVVRTHTFDDGKKVPQILMVDDDGSERTLTAGQVRLKAELVEQRPEAGDHLKVTLVNIEKRAGGKTLKIFNVQVTRGMGGAAPQATPATAPVISTATGAPVVHQVPVPAAAPAVPDPQAAAAALAALTPEQRAQLGLAPA